MTLEIFEYLCANFELSFKKSDLWNTRAKRALISELADRAPFLLFVGEIACDSIFECDWRHFATGDDDFINYG